MNKPIPEFENEEEEREFWATHDSTEYMDWSQAERAHFPNLRPSTQAISLRLPVSMLDEIRQLANKQDVPYQSLIKMFLRERIDQEVARNLPANYTINENSAEYLPRKKKKASTN
ncbi:MAG TPA: BrnA antitoxin family protein [Anaerolineales bacterium]|nr:BrnA antitoxin family protein [Anaerolineales bacterium]